MAIHTINEIEIIFFFHTWCLFLKPNLQKHLLHDKTGNLQITQYEISHTIHYRILIRDSSVYDLLLSDPNSNHLMKRKLTFQNWTTPQVSGGDSTRCFMLPRWNRFVLANRLHCSDFHIAKCRAHELCCCVVSYSVQTLPCPAYCLI